MIDHRSVANDAPTITIDLISDGGKGYGSKFRVGRVMREEGVVVVKCSRLSPDSKYRSAIIRIPRSALVTMLTKVVMQLPEVDEEASADV